jgi:hypothetical protein
MDYGNWIQFWLHNLVQSSNVNNRATFHLSRGLIQAHRNEYWVHTRCVVCHLRHFALFVQLIEGFVDNLILF